MKPGDIAVRGVRQSVPSPVVVGRVSAGVGPVELIDFFTLGTRLVQTGIVNGPGNPSPPGANVLQAENLNPLQLEEGAFITL